MPGIFVLSTIIILNIVLWIVFLVKFRGLFTTDDIIQSTRTELDKMIADVNRNTARDLNLIEDKLKGLKSVISEADRHLAAVRGELERQQQLAKFSQQVESSKQGGGVPRGTAQAAGRYRRQFTDTSADMGQDLFAAPAAQKPASRQHELFDEAADAPVEIVSKVGTRFSVEPERPDGGQGVPNVTFTKIPIIKRKDFGQQVLDLYDAGNSIETIANELGRSTTEVRMVIDMNS